MEYYTSYFAGPTYHLLMKTIILRINIQITKYLLIFSYKILVAKQQRALLPKKMAEIRQNAPVCQEK